MRKIHIGEEVWEWKVGKEHIVIRDPHRQKYAPTIGEVVGMTPDDVERGKWKQWLHITPSEVKTYIEDVIKEGL